MKDNAIFEQGLGAESGFPSPAVPFVEERLTLDKHFWPHATSCFLVRAKGESMSPLILPEDLLVVDRSKSILHGQVGLFWLIDHFTVKRLWREKGQVFLLSDNQSYKKIFVSQEMDFLAWGVVSSIHRRL